MENRIRHYRKTRGLTLAQLANLVGTTPQTISRLETNSMTVSMDWLERIGEALGVHAAQLIAPPAELAPEFVGTIGDRGMLMEAAAGDQRFELDLKAETPVAVRLAADCGPYAAGDVLVGDRLGSDEVGAAVGFDCLVRTSEGTVLLRRVAKNDDGRVTLVPLENGEEIAYDVALDWAARLVMRVSYLD